MKLLSVLRHPRSKNPAGVDRRVTHRPRFDVNDLAALRKEAEIHSKALVDNSKEFMQEIGELVNKIRSLQRDSNLFSGLYATLMDAVLRVSSQDGTLLDMNPSAEKFFGVKFEKDSGLHLKDVCSLSLDCLQKYAGGPPVEKLIRLPDGTIIDSTVAVIKIKHLGRGEGSEFLLTLRNLTEIVALREALKTRDIQFDALNTALNHSPNPVCIADNKQRIIFINKAYTEITGYSISDMLGKPLCSIIADKINQDVIKGSVQESLAKNLIWQGSVAFEDREKGLHYSNVTIIPVTKNEESHHFIALMTSDKSIQ